MAISSMNSGVMEVRGVLSRLLRASMTALSKSIHTYLAPYIPAEYIENIREYDTKALEAALTGGGE